MTLTPSVIAWRRCHLPQGGRQKAPLSEVLARRAREVIPRTPPHGHRACCKMRFPSVIPSQCAHWRGNPPSFGENGLPQPLAGLRNDEGRGTRNTLWPAANAAGHKHWNHITLFSRHNQIAPAQPGCDLERTFRRNLRAFALARMRSIPANKDVIPISSPRPAPGPKARRACCRRAGGGNPARSPAWRR